MKVDKKTYGASLQLPFRELGGEKLLQFIWQFGYYNNAALATSAGEPVSILFPGTINKNGGPDFLSAKIKIGNTTLFGNVELHLKTSDWQRHQHDADAQYRNVILHVVYSHDKDLPHNIPVLELESRISTLLLDRYNALLSTENFIPCGSAIAQVKALTWASWKERLLVERLSRKANYILELQQQNGHHWEETCWWLLARNFGAKLNSDAFEAIAKSLSINVLAKHKASIHQVEALLFGQAGLLHGEFVKAYPQMLQREYNYLRKKLTLQPVTIPLQFLRMRPGNFPTIRLAQLAVVVHTASHLFTKIIEARTINEVQAFFAVTANDFWHYHYTFDSKSPYRKKVAGTDFVNNLLINTAVPLLFAYGVYHSEESLKEKALRWLEELEGEKNSIVSGFTSLGVISKTAFDTQALLQLKNEYCSCKKCLQCAVGNFLLKNETGPSAVNR